MTSPYADLEALVSRLETLGGRRSEDGDGRMSELDHALQCAAVLKAAAPEDDALQLAGLLHDIESEPGEEREHAAAAARRLEPLLGARIARLAGLHVTAKRYLATTDADHRARLSAASLRTLALQGGLMDLEEAARFATDPFFHDACRLRVADDAAKVSGRPVPPLQSWREALSRAVAAKAAGDRRASHG